MVLRVRDLATAGPSWTNYLNEANFNLFLGVVATYGSISELLAEYTYITCRFR